MLIYEYLWTFLFYTCRKIIRLVRQVLWCTPYCDTKHCYSRCSCWSARHTRSPWTTFFLQNFRLFDKHYVANSTLIQHFFFLLSYDFFKSKLTFARFVHSIFFYHKRIQLFDNYFGINRASIRLSGEFLWYFKMWMNLCYT